MAHLNFINLRYEFIHGVILMNRLDPSIKTIWALSFLGRMLLLSLVLFFIEFFLVRPNIQWSLPIGLLSGALALFAILFSLVWPPLMYKFWQFDVRSDELFIERGVLTRIKTTAPYSRLQHIDVEQNVLERMMHLGKLVIYTAGTRGADIVLPGLPIEYAEALRDQLKNYSPEDAV